ncbi:MAG TPA: Gfo/Idh/MocA family oxidoreductase [Verrucomicrobiae bacterium]|jgi:predicted dehydrogenase|nr:Gfo/Idh/MocA family oxidoreductase [Verrucomicrobiae bacterium]
MKTTSKKPGLNRRRFLAIAGAAVAVPTFIPARALGRGGNAAPSNRIVMGVVGWGMQAPGNTASLMGFDTCQVVASCNIDKNHLAASLKAINDHNGNQDCKAYHDYREMMARTDIDAVMIAVPDNWHELIAVEALKNKKDVYGEKPLARTIAEQQGIVRAVEQNNRIWQMGSWQRSQWFFRKAAEIVRNGLIGKVTEVHVGLPSGHFDFAHTAGATLEKMGKPTHDTSYLATVTPGTPDWNAAVSDPPPELDFETWIGPARKEPYIRSRVHMNWRWNYNTGGGQLLDWIGHHCDIAHWGLGFDLEGPSEIEGHGEFPAANAIWNTCTKYRIELKYPQDIKMIIAGGHDDIKGGTKWIGTDGWVHIDRDNKFDSSNPEWKDWRSVPDELAKIKLYKSDNHAGNFLECVKSRKPTICPVQVGHHSAVPGHLSLISMLTGRKIRWDAKSETILGDEEASKLLSRPYRDPWKMA